MTGAGTGASNETPLRELRRRANQCGWVRKRIPGRDKVQRLIEIGDHLAGIANRYEANTDQDYLEGNLSPKNLQDEGKVVQDLRQMAVDVWKVAAEIDEIRRTLRGKRGAE